MNKMSQPDNQTCYEGIIQIVREKLKNETSSVDIPDFSSIPLPPKETEFLPDRIEEIIGDSTIASQYPVQSKNPLVRIYKILITKLGGCLVFPLTQRLSVTNFSFKKTASVLAGELELQRNMIRELTTRIEILEKALEYNDTDPK